MAKKEIVGTIQNIEFEGLNTIFTLKNSEGEEKFLLHKKTIVFNIGNTVRIIYISKDEVNIRHVILFIKLSDGYE